MPRRALFEKIGAERLRAVIEDFYARIFADVMIGFLFAGKDRARLIDKEYEMTARLLGADVAYTGKPMREAHARSPILGGHFERRLEILRQTLTAHAVDPEVKEAWIDHTLALRAQITPDRGSECKDSEAATRVIAAGPEPAAAADPGKLVGLGKRPRSGG
jgi:hemoglobin